MPFPASPSLPFRDSPCPASPCLPSPCLASPGPAWPLLPLRATHPNAPLRVPHSWVPCAPSPAPRRALWLGPAWSLLAARRPGTADATPPGMPGAGVRGTAPRATRRRQVCPHVASLPPSREYSPARLTRNSVLALRHARPRPAGLGAQLRPVLRSLVHHRDRAASCLETTHASGGRPGGVLVAQ